MGLYWRRNQVSAELADAMEALGAEYPLREGTGRPSLEFQPGASAGTLEITREGSKTRIAYGTLADALRGVGAALAGMPDRGGRISETQPFTTLGVMLDCSRNAVMEVAHVKKWLSRLALLGYNMMMLYTEDTYKLEGEPFFGFFRGAYSPVDLKEIDDHAARLGIEMIGCIQTLGHLQQVLKWPAYAKLRDTGDVVLAGEPGSYELIRKMIASYAECFRSRRIHIGMDESNWLGRGRYLDQNGYRNGFDIFNEHIGKVVAMCGEHGLRPMIWSDMYFVMGSVTNDDYDKDAVIPPDVKAAIPAAADFVYWDYYHGQEEDYLGVIQAHRNLGKEPIMASAVWTWGHLWYNRGITERNVAPCVSACKRINLKELFFTLWGDDGACCEFDSALAGLAFAAAKVFGEGEDSFRKRYQAVCGISYDAVVLPSELGEHAPSLLWDDPLMGLHWLCRRAQNPEHWTNELSRYRELAGRLSPYRRKTDPVDMAHAALLVDYLAAKIEFRMSLEHAYFDRDRDKLAAVVKDASAMMRMTSKLAESFRRQWLRRNRSAGFEAIDIRLGGLRQRYAEVVAGLRELLSGERESVWELDEGRRLPSDALAQSDRGPWFSVAFPSSSL